MARRSGHDREKKLIRELVDARGRTFAEEVGLSLRKPGPAALALVRTHLAKDARRFREATAH